MLIILYTKKRYLTQIEMFLVTQFNYLLYKLEDPICQCWSKLFFVTEIQNW